MARAAGTKLTSASARSIEPLLRTPSIEQIPVIRAAKEAIDYMLVEGKKRGIVITEIFAHRQSSSDRRGDPGEEIWKKIVRGHAVRVHRLRTNVALALPASNRRNGPGRPVPREWDPAGVGKY